MSGQLPPKRATLSAICSSKIRRSSSGRLPLARQNGASLQTVKHGFVQGPQLAMRVLQHAFDVLPANLHQIGLVDDGATGPVRSLRLDQGRQLGAN